MGKILGRPPNHLELALYAVMWSEHCSYKSSRLHLRRLPTEGPRVLVGPGENAGVIDAGDGIAVAIRIESHNHPSAIEPYQGAATGVGGILRDVFTMGARPLAVMDPLFFGPPDDARQRWLVEGVVSGISGYGNSVGVPTVGGELTFDPCYAQNPLVNVLCLGALPTERLVLGIASGPGNLAVLLGSSTGRDGIGGVSVLASAGFSGDEGVADDSKRPSVQVGDPFEEKRLIEACLELLDTKLVVGIQDLGGAGLACATSETAGRGGVGMDVDVSAVPRREDGMEPWEVMTSESQERMLAIVTPESWPEVAAICAKWEVRATVVGKVTRPEPDGGGRLRIRDGFDGPVLADVPAASLSDDAPLYDRPRQAPPRRAGRRRSSRRPTAPPICWRCCESPRWVYRQYDHQLFLNTVVGPGADAALLRLAGPGLPPSDRGVAITTDSNPRACALDPRPGHGARPGRGRGQPGLCRRHPGRRRQLPQLRQPRTPRGDVAAVRVHRRHGGGLPRLRPPGDRRQRQLLQRERRGGHRSHAGARRARTGRRGATRRRRDSGGRRAMRSSCSGAHEGPFLLEGTRWAAECRGHRGGAVPVLDVAAHQAVCSLVAELVAAQVAGETRPDRCRARRVGRRSRRRPGRDGGRGGHRLCGRRRPTRPGCSPSSPPASSSPRTTPRRCAPGPPSAGVPAAVIGRVGGARFTLGDLVDLPLTELVEAYEGSLAQALGDR